MANYLIFKNLLKEQKLEVEKCTLQEKLIYIYIQRRAVKEY